MPPYGEPERDIGQRQVEHEDSYEDDNPEEDYVGCDPRLHDVAHCRPEDEDDERDELEHEAYSVELIALGLLEAYALAPRSLALLAAQLLHCALHSDPLQSLVYAHGIGIAEQE